MNNFSTYFLYPSVIFVSKEPHCITTILGSCVAVCFWDPVLKHGGMSHFMLPLWNGEGLASPRYGNIAIEKLYDRMIALGSKKANIVAKVFGGGEVIDTETNYFQVGERNIIIAKEILEERKIPIVSSSLGGKYGRKIIMNTVTGKIKQRYIDRKIKEFKND